MNQKIKDGIIIGQSIYLKEDKRTGIPLYIRLLQLLFILAGGWSSIFTLIQCFSIPVPVTNINLAVLIFGVAFFALFLFSYFDVIKTMIIFLLYGFYIYYRFPWLQNGFYLMENLVLNKAEDYYEYKSALFIADYEMQERDLSLLLIMVLIPILVVLVAAVLRSRFVSLCNMIILVPIATSFAFGLIPSEICLFSYLLVMLYTTKAYLSGHQTNSKELRLLLQRVNSRAAIWLCVISILLFALIRLIFPPQQYEGVTQIKEAKLKIQDFMYSFTIEDITNGLIKLPNKGVATGGLDGGKLGGADRVKYDHTTHLKVIAPVSSASEGIYLKGYVGSEYTGDSWDSHDQLAVYEFKELIKRMDSSSFDPINQSAQLLSLTYLSRLESDYPFSYRQGKIEIEYEKANPKFIYVPYFTDYSKGNLFKYDQDLYVTPLYNNKKSYEINYYYNISEEEGLPILRSPAPSELSWGYYENEQLYREFVYETYTSLPESGLVQLREYMDTVQQELIGYDLMEVIKYIKDYLHRETSYSLSPGTLPEGKDFVEYFLFENKLGYCAHYASAATLMLRALGIPARYVEGYAAGMENINPNAKTGESRIQLFSEDGSKSQSSQMVELLLLDSDAHAWVEVYMDYCGWVPIEFTPADGIEGTTAVTQNLAITGDEKGEEPTPSPTSEPTLTPTPTVDPEVPTDIPNRNTQEQPTLPGDTESMNKAKGNSQMKRILLSMTAFVTVIAVLLSIVIVVRWNKKVRIIKANRSKKALLLYQEMERLLRICGSISRGTALEDQEAYVKKECTYINGDQFEACMELIKKARFSKEVLNPSEYHLVKSFYYHLYQGIYEKVHLLKKIYLRLLFLL